MQLNPANNLPATATIHCTITPIPSIAVNDFYTINKGTNQTLTVLSNDYDLSGDFFNIISITTSTYASSISIINGGLALQYIAPNLVSPPGSYDTFTYTINNTDGLQATATVQIQLINSPPYGLPDYAAIHWNSTVNVFVLLNDSDPNPPDRPNLFVSNISTSPSHGSAAIVGGQNILYTPNLGFVGTDTFYYQLNDLFVNSNPVLVTVYVQNAAPIANNDFYTVFWGKTSVFNVLMNDTDPDLDPFVISSVTQGAHGVVTILNGQLQYAQSNNFVGIDTFTYTITDWNLASTATVTVNITNTPPFAVNDAYTMHFSQSGNILSVLSNDYDSNGLTITIISMTAPSIGSGVIVNNGTGISFSNSAGSGTSVFTYTISNGGLLYSTSTATVTITLTDTTAPSAVPVSQTLHWRTYNPGTVLNLQPSQFTSSGDQINLYLTTPNKGGSAVVQGTGVQTCLYKQQQTGSTIVGQLPWNFVYTGVETFNYILGDGAMNSSSTVSITTYNTAPTAQSITQSFISVGIDTITVVPTYVADADVPDQPFLQLVAVYSLVESSPTPSVPGSVTFTATQVKYTPAASWAGTAVMFYTVTDGLANATKTITVTVIQNTAANKNFVFHWTPTPVSATLNVTSGLYTTGNQDYLFYPYGFPTAPMVGSNASVDTTYGSTYTRTNVLYFRKTYYVCSDYFQVGYTSDNVTSNPISVFITITNTAPTSNSTSATTHFYNPAGVIINALSLCYDADGDSLSLVSVGTPSPNWGTATIIGSTIKYVPTTANIGTTTFSYTCTDGMANSTSTISILETDTAPSATAVSQSLQWRAHQLGYSINVTALSNAYDIDHDSIYLSSIGAISNSQAGSLVFAANGLVTVTPNPSYPKFTGTYTFTFTISDSVLTYTQTCTVNVYDTAPVAYNDYYTFNGTSPVFVVRLNVTTNDTDADSLDSGKLTVFSTTSGVITSDGLGITFTAPPAGYIGTYTFTYLVTDGILTSMATVYVTITATPPTASPYTLITQWSQVTQQLNVASNDIGYYSFGGITQNPTQGVVTLISGGPVLTYKANSALTFTTTVGNNQTFTDTFKYSISSNYSLTATGTVTVIVWNTIPTAVPDAYTFMVSYANPQRVFNVLANDISGDVDSIKIQLVTSITGYGTFSYNGSTIFYNPKTNFIGVDIIQYTITDSQAVSTPVNVTITITPNSLSCTPYYQLITKGGNSTFDVSLQVTETGGFPLTYALSGSNVYTKATVTMVGSIVTYITVPRHSTPPTSNINYTVADGINFVSCLIETDFYNNAPTSYGVLYLNINKGTSSFKISVLQNWTDPDSADIPFLTVTSVTNQSCAGAKINTDYSLTIVMSSLNFTGSCQIPYTVSDHDLDNPKTSNSSTLLYIEVAAHAPVAVTDLIYVAQASGPAVITTATLLSNDYAVDPGSSFAFLNFFCATGQCAQTPYMSNGNIIWPNSAPTSCNSDYFSYTIYNTGDPSLTSTTTVQIKITDCTCTNVAIDLMFLADGSGSISSQNWTVVQAFLTNVSKQFTIGGGSTQTRVGCIQFASSITEEIKIYSTAATTPATVYNTLSTMSQIGSGTATLLGFQQCMSDFSQVAALAPTRIAVAKVIVITTDGQPNDPCSCSCCYCDHTIYSGCSTEKCSGNYSYTSCSFSPASGVFCFPCASPLSETTYINNLKISHNNSNANYKIVSLGIGSALTQYNNFGWSVVQQMSYNPALAIQVSWSNIQLAVQTIVDAACDQS
jgi:hypothetical protein